MSSPTLRTPSKAVNSGFSSLLNLSLFFKSVYLFIVFSLVVSLSASILLPSSSVAAANANLAISFSSFFLADAIANKPLFNAAALSAKEPGVPTASDNAKATLPLVSLFVDPKYFYNLDSCLLNIESK